MQTGSAWLILWDFANLTLFFSTCLFFVAFLLALISKDKALPSNQAHNFVQSTVAPLRHQSVILNQKSSVDDPYVQIEKLGELKEKGLITESEFNTKKKQILDL